MKKRLLGAGLLFCASVASAALPPYYQSVNEMKSILDDSKIASLFTSGRAIEAIIKTDNGYEVSSADCYLEVTVKYLPAPGGIMGPARYELVVPDQLQCDEDEG